MWGRFAELTILSPSFFSESRLLSLFRQRNSTPAPNPAVLYLRLASLSESQMYLDYLANPSAPEFANVDPSIQSMPRSKSLLDKACEKTFVSLSSSAYKSKVYPSTQCMRRLGNMYTASVYGGLASILDSVESEELKGKRIAMFSFGSGLAASWFTLRVKGDTKKIRETMDLKKRLAEMEVRPCKEFIEALQVRATSTCGAITRRATC